jgi:hypothetical protein
MKFIFFLFFSGLVVSCSSEANIKSSKNLFLTGTAKFADTIFISDSIMQIYNYDSLGNLREISWTQKGTDKYEKIIFSESGRLSSVDIINSARWEDTKTGSQRIYNIQKLKLDTCGIPIYYMFMKNYHIIDSVAFQTY